jgi:hypothetical protein
MGSPNINIPAVRRRLAMTIRAFLEKNEWSESQLSRESFQDHNDEKIGISQKQVNNLVRERYGCTVEALHVIARAFKVKAYQMLIDGFAKADVSSQRLDKLVHAYLIADPNMRAVFDRLADSARKTDNV